MASQPKNKHAWTKNSQLVLIKGLIKIRNILFPTKPFRVNEICVPVKRFSSGKHSYKVRKHRPRSQAGWCIHFLSCKKSSAPFFAIRLGSWNHWNQQQYQPTLSIIMISTTISNLYPPSRSLHEPKIWTLVVFHNRSGDSYRWLVPCLLDLRSFGRAPEPCGEQDGVRALKFG